MLGIDIIRWGGVPWNEHLFSLCITGPRFKWTWWFGVVLHKWGLRFGVGPREICIHWS